MRFQVVGKEDVVEGITVGENQLTYYPGGGETTVKFTKFRQTPRVTS